MSELDSGWEERAEELRGEGNVPKVRARVVALREAGHTYSEIAEKAGLNDRSNAKSHVDAYEDQLEKAEWLVENGPEEDDL